MLRFIRFLALYSKKTLKAQSEVEMEDGARKRVLEKCDSIPTEEIIMGTPDDKTENIEGLYIYTQEY